MHTLNYNLSLTYIPSEESNLKEIQIDASLFMDLGSVGECECVALVLVTHPGNCGVCSD